MNIRKAAIVFNGFIHDFAAGYWLALMVAIGLMHRLHGSRPDVAPILNGIERNFFWQSIAAVVAIAATGAGRTFTYIENWYGPDAERVRRRMLIIKHVVLLAIFGAGYFLIYPKVFHG
ncbi:hypothetical protein [Geobacter sp.]|uniref:hypothetical protein n=1 Tax=Geobacter sp. TaxID=46610 RepID=UPI002613B307|nr:hypothetical protein [Geobacter sp.]